jgi:hypothetical protein
MGDEQILLVLFSPDLHNVDVDVPARIGPGLPTLGWALDTWQRADPGVGTDGGARIA